MWTLFPIVPQVFSRKACFMRATIVLTITVRVRPWTYSSQSKRNLIAITLSREFWNNYSNRYRKTISTRLLLFDLRFYVFRFQFQLCQCFFQRYFFKLSYLLFFCFFCRSGNNLSWTSFVWISLRSSYISLSVDLIFVRNWSAIARPIFFDLIRSIDSRPLLWCWLGAPSPASATNTSCHCLRPRLSLQWELSRRRKFEVNLELSKLGGRVWSVCQPCAIWESSFWYNAQSLFAEACELLPPVEDTSIRLPELQLSGQSVRSKILLPWFGWIWFAIRYIEFRIP